MKVLVVYHSIYGHVLQLAKAVEEGVKSVFGVEAVFRRAPEFSPYRKGTRSRRWPCLEDLAGSKEYSACLRALRCPEDLAICRAQGKRVAELAKKIRS
jgi:hypothetical protein